MSREAITDTKADEAMAGTSTVGKAIEVLELVYDFGRPVKFRELEAVSRFPKPTLYRFVQTLTEHGMLNFDADDGAFYLGTRLVRLAHAAWRQCRIAPVAKPHLDALAHELGETVYLSKLDGGQCVCLERASPDELEAIFLDPMRVYPAYCTAVGKAMLSCLAGKELEQVLNEQSFFQRAQNTLNSAAALDADLRVTRSRGYAIEDEEHSRGIIAVAVPITTGQGRLLGGIGIHAPDRRTDLSVLKSHVPAMQNTAEQIAKDAANWLYPVADKAQNEEM